MHSKLLLIILSVLIFAVTPVRAAEEDDTALLNTLGCTTGQSLLITHMAVGTLADAFVGKAYKSDQATTFVNTYINITKEMKEQMSKLVAADTLSKNDAKFIANTVEVLDLVIEEGKDLKTFIESGDKPTPRPTISRARPPLKRSRLFLE